MENQKVQAFAIPTGPTWACQGSQSCNGNLRIQGRKSRFSHQKSISCVSGSPNDDQIQGHIRLVSKGIFVFGTLELLFGGIARILRTFFPLLRSSTNFWSGWELRALIVGSIGELLSAALLPPEPLAVQNVVDFSKMIGALDVNENLTHLVSRIIFFCLKRTKT
ncbi:hypothetical protein Lser_V15G23381 [Lactuca serriola]